MYRTVLGVKIKNKNQYKSYDKSSIQYSVAPFFTVNLGIEFHILSRNIQNYWYMMKNKKVIVFLESGIFFSPANF
jgi:hypothetical protein